MSLWWLPLQQSVAAGSELRLSASIFEVNSVAMHRCAHMAGGPGCVGQCGLQFTKNEGHT